MPPDGSCPCRMLGMALIDRLPGRRIVPSVLAQPPRVASEDAISGPQTAADNPGGPG